MRLDQIAQLEVVTLNVSDNCYTAAAKMEELNIRHIPVLHDGIPVGMVSDRDLLSYFGWWIRSPDTPDAEIADWAESIPLEDVMTTPLVSLPPDDPLDRAARLMLDKKISAIPLVGESRLVGIVTESDFLRFCIGEVDWQLQKVIDCMTAAVFSVGPQDAILTAGRLMRDKQIRHLVVLDNDQLVGMLSDRDILAGFPKNPDAIGLPNSVSHIMTSHIETVRPDMDLAFAANQMIAHKVGALPVVDDGQVIGIITETDLLRVFLTNYSKAGWD